MPIAMPMPSKQPAPPRGVAVRPSNPQKQKAMIEAAKGQAVGGAPMGGNQLQTKPAVRPMGGAAPNQLFTKPAIRSPVGGSGGIVALPSESGTMSTPPSGMGGAMDSMEKTGMGAPTLSGPRMGEQMVGGAPMGPQGMQAQNSGPGIPPGAQPGPGGMAAGPQGPGGGQMQLPPNLQAAVAGGQMDYQTAFSRALQNRAGFRQRAMAAAGGQQGGGAMASPMPGQAQINPALQIQSLGDIYSPQGGAAPPGFGGQGPMGGRFQY